MEFVCLLFLLLYYGFCNFYVNLILKIIIDALYFLSLGNLTYHIPTGIAEDRFSVDPHTGVVSLRAPLDRETRGLYIVPVYVTSPPRRTGSQQIDVTTVAVRVIDVNDHAPEFRPGTCYTVTIPENSDLAVIHTVVATDLDSGPNGEVTYSITGE
jgi:protocadherin-16/23